MYKQISLTPVVLQALAAGIDRLETDPASREHGATVRRTLALAGFVARYGRGEPVEEAAEGFVKTDDGKVHNVFVTYDGDWFCDGLSCGKRTLGPNDAPGHAWEGGCSPVEAGITLYLTDKTSIVLRVIEDPNEFKPAQVVPVVIT